MQTTDVVIAGSFAGEVAAAMALRRGARAFLGNAAGLGRDGAGMSGLALGQRLGAPAAALSEQSARVGDGPDSYAQGVIGRGAASVDTRGAIVYDGLEGTVTAMVSVSFATPAHTGHVICAGSHTAAVTGRYVAAYGFPVAGIIGNDAGVGKDQSGIAGLALLQASGIPAASVAALSACIGSGESTYVHGIISYCNAVAQERGVRPGQSARDACLALLRVYHGPRA